MIIFIFINIIIVTILHPNGMVSYFCILLIASNSIALQCAALPHLIPSLHVGFCHCRVWDK